MKTFYILCIAIFTFSVVKAKNNCEVSSARSIDVEVSIIPLKSARPGFNADYKIVYYNKGTQAQSGSITFTFDNEMLTYSASSLMYDSFIYDTFTWNYYDLESNEKQEIFITLLVNSPTDSPAVNIDDLLKFSAIISPVNGDERPEDNYFTLVQKVKGSLDPNDKRCLQGDAITIDKVGKFVHYLIRFENIGTSFAENVIIEDFIDPTKFDIASLESLDASHNYITAITGNTVQFIFNDINLAFEDENNDGHVLFKVKTLATLVVGDVFTNNAEIVFDFNAPISTNTTSTIVEELLAVSDFNFDDAFVLFPNPVINKFQLKQTSDFTVNSFEIYSILGKEILRNSTFNIVDQIDVSALNPGTYILKLNNLQGTFSTLFIKK